MKSSEVHGFLFAWFLKFFYRVSFVFGWTMLLGLFVVNYGVSYLPYLFVVSAVFSFVSSIVFSFFVDVFEKRFLMILTLLTASVVFLIAYFFASDSSFILFFSLLMVGVGIFLNQYKVLSDALIEDFFTPLKSEKIFPLIEGADTLGALFAGFFVVVFSSFSNIYSFVFLWVFLLLVLISIVFFSRFLIPSHFLCKRKSLFKPRFFSRTFSDVRQSSSFGFIKTLSLVVFVNWVIYNLLEFQYVKAIYNSVAGVVLDGGSGFEHAFIHELGVIFMFLSFSMLVVQFFVAGKVLSSLGVVGSMMVNALLLLLGFFGMLISFNPFTAIFARDTYMIGSVLQNAGYHSSFYAVDERFRLYLREFTEGFVRPLGAIFGTLLLIVVQNLFASSHQVFYVNAMLAVFGILFLYLTYSLKGHYTEASLSTLIHSESLKERLLALDVLSQRGHSDLVSVMEGLLFDPSQPCHLKNAILKSFSTSRDKSTLDLLFKVLSSDQLTYLRATCLDVLSCYDKDFLVSMGRDLRFDTLSFVSDAIDDYNDVS